MEYVQTDGGRSAAGFKGTAPGDCVTRAITIATGKPYREVYDDLYDGLRSFRPGRSRFSKAVARRIDRGGGRSGSTPRNCVNRLIYRPYLESLGWRWVPVLCNATWADLPKDRPLIVKTKGHMAAVMNGVLHDQWNCAARYPHVMGYFEKGSHDS